MEISRNLWKLILIAALILGAASFYKFQFISTSFNDSNGSQPVSTNFNEYRNADFKFSFQYPKNLTLQEFDDERGHVILFEASGKTSDVESPKTSDVEELAGFQIFIAPFDEEGPITPERIKKDLLNIVVENPTPTKVCPSTGSGQADALSFIGEGDGFKTAEVWFVWPPEPYPNGNYLYQITAKVEDAKLLEGIISTWSFQ